MISPDARCAHRELEAHLRPFVARRLASPADVDDVVQDVFLRMQRGLSGLRDEERLGPWVYQLARSAIAEHRRQRARHPLGQGEPCEQPSADEEQENEAEQTLALHIAPFVAILASPYREALTLTELEGMTQKQAADMLGISLSGMKSRVQRGREKLRALLDACCEIALDARGRVISCEPRPAKGGGQAPSCACDGPGSRPR